MDLTWIIEVVINGDYSQSVRVADIIIFGSQITPGSSLQHLDSILNL